MIDLIRLILFDLISLICPTNNRLKMENEAPDRRKRVYALRRAILDYGMGALIFGFGVFLLIAPKLGYAFSVDDLYRYAFAGLCFLYGGFRAYRGYKQNYFD